VPLLPIILDPGPGACRCLIPSLEARCHLVPDLEHAATILNLKPIIVDVADSPPPGPRVPRLHHRLPAIDAGPEHVAVVINLATIVLPSVSLVCPS
jgi:hypothetical protein